MDVSESEGSMDDIMTCRSQGGASARTEKQVCEAAEAAGLHMVDNYPVQVFRFSDELRNGCRLLELHPDLEKSLRKGDRYVI